jgi:SPP1 gp7 family putative phage head morphogenesis protein
MRRLAAPKPVSIGPVRPNAGVQARYQKQLDDLIERMARAVKRTVLAVYRRKPPEMARDESPASALRDAMARLSADWLARFEEFGQTHGKSFAKAAIAGGDRSFRDALARAGFTVDFHMTRAANDIMRATISEQVNLIRSIPAEYLTQVEGMVMRSVQLGRDMGSLSQELQQQLGVTKRRAAIIARDQNNKATASITKARQLQLGITEAKWLHSAGGRKPRPEHVAFSGKTYDIAKGAFLEGKWVWPGTEINCRCVSISIIPGL